MISPAEVIQILEEIARSEDSTISLDKNSMILNGDYNFDSMALVQLCISLEEKSNKFGFDFDWTSEKAMSSMNSIFRTPLTICNEFNKQLLNAKAK